MIADSAYRTYLHGEAVAVGICAALRLGARLQLTPTEVILRTEELLQRLGLSIRTRR